MRIHGALEGWLALEATLAAPGIFGLIVLMIARPLRELRLMTTDAFLQAVLYPQAGAVIGAVVGVGAGELWAGKPDGLFIVVFGGVILPIIAGGAIGKRLRVYLREDSQRFAPGCWQTDVERLGMTDQLTLQDRRSYRKRAAELTTEGNDKCTKAETLSFGQFWQNLSRRTRWTGYFWVPFGAFVAANGAQSVGSAWCLVAIPLGGSWFGYQWVIWRSQKAMTAAKGRNLLEGAELIREREAQVPRSREAASLRKSATSRHLQRPRRGEATRTIVIWKDRQPAWIGQHERALPINLSAHRLGMTLRIGEALTIRAARHRPRR